MTRLGKNGKAKSDRFCKAWNPESIRIRSAPSGQRSSSGRKKLSRGASLRGQGTPADPARLRSERARNLSKTLYIAGLRISGVLACGFRAVCGLSNRGASGSCGFPSRKYLLYFSSSPRRNSYRSMAATTPTAPSSRCSVRCTRPRQRTRTGPASVISFGRVSRISTGEPSFTSLARKKYTPRELTSRDSVLVSPAAAPVVHLTVSGSRMENRWVVRRSEPVKEVLLLEGRVYPGGG